MSFRTYLKFVIWYFKWASIFSPILFPIFGTQYIRCNIIEFVLAEIGCVILSLFTIYFFTGKDSKCPYCKRPFALKETNREVVSKENVSVLVETKMRNNDQKVTGTAEQYVPGVKTTYKVYYTCKHCGKVVCRTFSDKTPSI